MKQKRFTHILRTMIALVILGVLVSLIGGAPASVTSKQQSYIIQASTTVVAAQLVENHLYGANKLNELTKGDKLKFGADVIQLIILYA